MRALPERNAGRQEQKFLAEVQLLRDAKQYQAAYDMLAQASAAAPDDADLIYDQAMVAEKLNRLDEMERLLRQPDRAQARQPERLQRARLLARRSQGAPARSPHADPEGACSCAPDDPFIADSLGWVEFRMGNTAEALRILEAAYKRRPDPEIGAHLGEVLWSHRPARPRAWRSGRKASLADADNETLQETLKRLRVKL